MVLVASASGHRHHRAAKSSRPAALLASPCPSPTASKPSAGPGLDGFSFSWGAQRRLRCSKDGAPVYASSSPSPSSTHHPHTPSPNKDKPKPPPQDTPAGVGSSRPQRPRNLRQPRYAASRPDGASPTALQYPSAPALPRKRGFAVALTKEEIARDFAAIRRWATRPVPATRRTSKKRPRPVQTAIDKMCPGLLLLDVDLDNYKIDERGQQR